MVCVRRRADLAADFPEPQVYTASQRTALVLQQLQTEVVIAEVEAELDQLTLHRLPLAFP